MLYEVITVGGLAVEPVVGATQAKPLRRDDADVIGRKGLAERAAVVGLDRLVSHGAHALFALAVDAAGLGEKLGDLLLAA